MNESPLLSLILDGLKHAGSYIIAGASALFAFLVRREVKRYDALADSHASLERKLTENYATKSSVDAMRDDLKESISDHRAESRARWESVEAQLHNIHAALLQRGGQ